MGDTKSMTDRFLHLSSFATKKKKIRFLLTDAINEKRFKKVDFGDAISICYFAALDKVTLWMGDTKSISTPVSQNDLV